jgi:hypothetical protein
MKTKKKKENPIVSQKVIVSTDNLKDKNIFAVIKSFRIYADNSEKVFTRKITKALIAKIKKVKKADVNEFKKINERIEACNEKNLAIDSKSMKKNLCNHARVRQHYDNPVARLAERDDLIVQYSKKEKAIA